MEPFKVGDVAIYVRGGDKYYGRECVIASDLHSVVFHDADAGEFRKGFQYMIDFHDGETGFCASPEHLERRDEADAMVLLTPPDESGNAPSVSR